MSIIPGCTWVQFNTALISNTISNDNDINASLVIDKFVTWKSLDFSLKPEHRLNKSDNFKKVKEASGRNSLLNNNGFCWLRKRRYLPSKTVCFSLTTKTRVIVNHGGESVLDNSIALHPYYGFPVIPASAIKGVTRHFCEEFLKLNSEGEKMILEIFGNKSDNKNAVEGKIVFLDAWPERLTGFFEIDIFTPHYPDYYAKKTLPKDNQNPIPIPFLAVKEGIVFEFALMPSKICKEAEATVLVDKVKEWVSGALKTFGIGAKTGASYGFFE